MTEDLLERKEGRVAILTMNRPDRLNAMSGAMLDALLEALQSSPFNRYPRLLKEIQ